MSSENIEAQAAIASVQDHFRDAETPKEEWDNAIKRAIAAIRHDIWNRRDGDFDDFNDKGYRGDIETPLDSTLKTWEIILKEILGEVPNLNIGLKSINEARAQLGLEPLNEEEPAIAAPKKLNLRDFIDDPKALQTRDGRIPLRIRPSEMTDWQCLVAFKEDRVAKEYYYLWDGCIYDYRDWKEYRDRASPADLFLREEVEPNDNPRFVAISSGGVLADAISDTETGEVRTIEEVIEDFRNVPPPDHWRDRPKEKTELDSPLVWNADVVQRLKKLVPPPLINDYINLRIIRSRSEVWVITTIVNESFFAGLLEIGFTRDHEKEAVAKHGESVFKVYSLHCEEILRELVEDLTPQNGYYRGSSANTFPRYYLLGDHPQ